MRHLIVCCDGTWNTPEDTDAGVPAPTNVVRLHHALAAATGTGVPQIAYYHPGVGTGRSWWDKVVGGGAGAGLNDNIKSAYRFLCQHYQDGDRLFLFGFSRGAYTVRSLAGLIGRVGLLDLNGLSAAEGWKRIATVFKEGYRKKRQSRGDWEAWNFLDTLGPDNRPRVPVHFLGVWDTVGALGIPDDMAVLNLIDEFKDYTFHDTELGKHIVHARHAVALDEERASFQPTLWTDTPQARTLWFPGVHGDVGGGYADAGLSDGALAWMMDEAQACGLAFDAGIRQQIHPDAQGTLHDSATGAFQLLPLQPRGVPHSGSGLWHASALARRATPSIRQGRYRQEVSLPATVPVFAVDPWNATGVWLEAGVTYRFTATGEWLDKDIACGPDGAEDGRFHLGEVMQWAGTVSGHLEKAWNTISGNHRGDFHLSRRHEGKGFPWFVLVGAVANGRGADAQEKVKAHETFCIGQGCLYTPEAGGYLHAYANDGWRLYANNRGQVRLLIERVAPPSGTGL
ncbi:DUF2235 domain-containing protein [Ideonella livida]|uniref:DUF2235 domain-containing protein n=1 Tax=Ideonella livida TaxID=2707176 RepID=A0A7C9TLU7_9BURK|nr:DUF2235 domain-containing protein [Ideonella livida]NDY92882.1 DUF2235 domain-containing protein [Ideonella livida]